MTSTTTEPIRVCFLIDRLQIGGTETQLIELINRLDRARIQPSLCLLDGEDEESRNLEPKDCVVRRLGVRHLLRLSTLSKAYRLARWLEQERIDLLQAYFPDSTYFGMIAGKLARIPVICTRRNLGYWLTPTHRLLGRFSSRFAACTVTNCEAARQACIEQERPRAESVIVLRNGIDLERFRAIRDLRETWRARAPRVGAVANLRGVKGLGTLVQAASIVLEAMPDVRFAVAGEGDQRPVLARMIADYQLENRFQLIGSTKDIPGFLAGLDVAVLCSSSEALSNALLEYMAAGRAIVATAVGGNVELIEHEVHGLLVSPTSPCELSTALIRLLGDRRLATQCGELARRRVTDLFAWPAVVRSCEDFYGRLVANPSNK